MTVADVLAGDGYYSELLSDIVGPQGHVYLINNAAFDHWSEPDLPKRLAGNRLPNVTHQTVDLNDMQLPAASLDAVLLIKLRMPGDERDQITFKGPMVGKTDRFAVVFRKS
jgi:predicted methyltransferase